MVLKVSAVRVCAVALLAWVLFGCSGGGDGGTFDVGATVPDFAVTSASDSTAQVHFANLAGKVVLVDFWATWCGPCRMALPHIQSIWKDNKDRGVEVIAVSSEDAGTVSAFQTQEKFEMPLYVDADKKMTNAFGVNGYPTTLVIGKNGKVVYSVVGTGPEVETELDAAVAHALQ